MDEEAYRVFEQEAIDRLTELNQQLEAAFRIGTYSHWDFNQEANEFLFSHDGTSQVVAKVQIVGSISNPARTWLWSWANASILEKTRDQIHRVREFGISHRIFRLMEAKWNAEEADGWAMAAISAAILGARGAYRCPIKAGFLFVIFTDIYFGKKSE